jgi:hypothetical protein
MADESLYDYLYVVEWDDSVHRPPYTVTHKIKLNSGVNREDFEKFMADDGFAQVAAVKTRIGEVAAQYLLTEASGPPTRPEDLDLDLSSFATRTSVTKFRCVSSWRRT